MLHEVNRVRKVDEKRPLPTEILPMSWRVVMPLGEQIASSLTVK